MIEKLDDKMIALNKLNALHSSINLHACNNLYAMTSTMTYIKPCSTNCICDYYIVRAKFLRNCAMNSLWKGQALIVERCIDELILIENQLQDNLFTKNK
jgi:hypothetical protein